MSEPILTVAIPTYNRAAKVERLLRGLCDQMTEESVRGKVLVVVSDNASTDTTPLVLTGLQRAGLPFRWVRQERNGGMDGNVRALHSLVTTPYLTIFGDDDVPFPGYLTRVVRALEDKRPDLLLFSFQQPVGSPRRVFESDGPVSETRDPAKIIDLATRYPKVSIYVYRRVGFSEANRAYLDDVVDGTWWLWLGLVFATLSQSANPCVVTIADQLAGTDHEADGMNGVPPIWYLRMEDVCNHPYIRRHAPTLRREWRDQGYCIAVTFCLKAWNHAAYENSYTLRGFIRALPWRVSVLVRHPKIATQFLVVKAGLAGAWPRVRAVLEPVRRPLARRSGFKPAD